MPEATLFLKHKATDLIFQVAGPRPGSFSGLPLLTSLGPKHLCIPSPWHLTSYTTTAATGTVPGRGRYALIPSKAPRLHRGHQFLRLRIPLQQSHSKYSCLALEKRLLECPHLLDWLPKLLISCSYKDAKKSLEDRSD